jgi:hypothetical protein
MTTYSYTITLGDSEHLALEAALKLMIDHCETMLSNGAGAPFWAHRQSCQQILDKLRSAPPTMTSTNNFFEDRN